MKEYRKWHEGEIFYKEYDLTFSRCDVNRNIKLSELMIFAADAGGEDYTEKGLPYEYMVEKGFAFLLSRANYHFERMPQSGEKVTIKTWERCAKGPEMIRDYQLHDEKGNAIVSIVSSWVLVNPKSRKILRPSKFTLKDLNAINVTDRKINCEDCSRIRPPENMEKIGERKMMFSDLDGNGHVNNANYSTFSIDCLPEEYQRKQLEYFRINFSNEAKLGETIEIYADFSQTQLSQAQKLKTEVQDCAEQEKITVVGKKQEKVCFECVFEYKE